MYRRLIQSIMELVSVENKAMEKQKEKGVQDVGKRSAVTAGKHLDPLVREISRRLESLGIPRNEIKTGRSDLRLPGYFRREKAWDLLVYSKHCLVGAIEFKSIAGSFGNNLNNRIEEALGSALDFRVAEQQGVLGDFSCSPFLGFVMVVFEDTESLRTVKNQPLDPRLNPDSVFENTNRIERFKISLERMIQEKIYDAAWLVIFNPETKEIKEPYSFLNFDSFWKILSSKVCTGKGE